MLSNVEWFKYKSPKMVDEVSDRFESLCDEVYDLEIKLKNDVNELEKELELREEELENADALCRKILDIMDDEGRNSKLLNRLNEAFNDSMVDV